MVAKTSAAVDDAKGMLKTVDGAAGDIKLAIGDFRKLTESANSLMKKAATGDGTLGTLISDRQTAENLKALIINMRRSGVLFYKDRPLSGAEASTPPPAAVRPRSR